MRNGNIKYFVFLRLWSIRRPVLSLLGDEEYEENIIPTIIPNWDHSPRSRGKSLVLNHAEPSYFARHMKEAIKRIENKPLDHRLAFVKSWNEWAEGNYLEPDLHYGKRYLEVIKKNVVEG